MTENLFTLFKFIFAWGWRFMTGFYIPGTNVTFGAFTLFVMFLFIVKKFIVRVFNDNGASDDSKS